MRRYKLAYLIAASAILCILAAAVLWPKPPNPDIATPSEVYCTMEENSDYGFKQIIRQPISQSSIIEVMQYLRIDGRFEGGDPAGRYTKLATLDLAYADRPAMSIEIYWAGKVPVLLKIVDSNESYWTKPHPDPRNAAGSMTLSHYLQSIINSETRIKR